jgi:hypothetical protein
MRNASWTRHHEEQHLLVVFLSLEHVVLLNQQALEFLRSGQEFVATRVLSDAVRLLAMIPVPVGRQTAAPPAPGDNQESQVAPYGIMLFNLPSYHMCREAPRSVVSIVDNGSFSLHHGLGNTRDILVGLTLYHMAVVIHRGCCRDNGMARCELSRARDLYDACCATIAHVPELGLLKSAVDSSVSQLHTMFDYPAAA